jgi:hypothetical protein
MLFQTNDHNYYIGEGGRERERLDKKKWLPDNLIGKEKKKNTTFNNGSLGSHIDEEHSKV